MTLGLKKIFISDDVFTFKITLFGVPLPCSLIPYKTECTYSITQDIKEKNQLTKDFDPRVILVLDPITFCSE
jgi:hypothetical protein